MGGNPAEAHPCGFKWVIEAKAQNRARLIVVDPRFTRTAAVADVYAPDPARHRHRLPGRRHQLPARARQDPARVREGVHQRALHREARASGSRTASSPATTQKKRKYDKTTWAYELDEDGFAKVDPTLQHPRCVYQLMKTHYERYTPEKVSEITGTPKDQFLEDLRDDRRPPRRRTGP